MKTTQHTDRKGNAREYSELTTEITGENLTGLERTAIAYAIESANGHEWGQRVSKWELEGKTGYYVQITHDLRDYRYSVSLENGVITGATIKANGGRKHFTYTTSTEHYAENKK